jgi:hypothetical protein
MSRSVGTNKAAVQARAQSETVTFNLRLMTDDLRLLRLRLAQAIRRDGELTDLLLPGVELVDGMQQKIAEALEALG